MPHFLSHNKLGCCLIWISRLVCCRQAIPTCMRSSNLAECVRTVLDLQGGVCGQHKTDAATACDIHNMLHVSRYEQEEHGLTCLAAAA